MRQKPCARLRVWTFVMWGGCFWVADPHRIPNAGFKRAGYIFHSRDYWPLLLPQTFAFTSSQNVMENSKIEEESPAFPQRCTQWSEPEGGITVSTSELQHHQHNSAVNHDISALFPQVWPVQPVHPHLKLMSEWAVGRPLVDDCSNTKAKHQRSSFESNSEIQLEVEKLTFKNSFPELCPKVVSSPLTNMQICCNNAQVYSPIKSRELMNSVYLRVSLRVQVLASHILGTDLCYPEICCSVLERRQNNKIVI